MAAKIARCSRRRRSDSSGHSSVRSAARRIGTFIALRIAAVSAADNALPEASAIARWNRVSASLNESREECG